MPLQTKLDLSVGGSGGDCESPVVGSGGDVLVEAEPDIVATTGAPVAGLLVETLSDILAGFSESSNLLMRPDTCFLNVVLELGVVGLEEVLLTWAPLPGPAVAAIFRLLA